MPEDKDDEFGEYHDDDPFCIGENKSLQTPAKRRDDLPNNNMNTNIDLPMKKLTIEDSTEDLNWNEEPICCPNEECSIPLLTNEKRFISEEPIEDDITDSLAIHILNFREIVLEYLKKFIDLIECTAEQKKNLLLKSEKILDSHISRAEKGGFTIRITANLKNIAANIIYTVASSNENMPKITTSYMSNISGISSDNIARYYNKYFKHLYPRIGLSYTTWGFDNIKKIISLFFFEEIMSNEIKISKLVMRLKDNVQKNIELPQQLTQKDIKVLQQMVNQDKDKFIKYFTDLGKLIKLLIITSNIHKKIGATLVIKPLTDFLEEKGINLLSTSANFHKNVIDIVDFLKKSRHSDFFPNRSTASKDQPKDQLKANRIISREYRKIIGSKLLLYAIKNIYGGKYFKDGKGKCLECSKEGLVINTDISRLSALEFHHKKEKKIEFNESYLYHLFSENRANPNFLDYMIKLMESENVKLVCRNHHKVKYHNKYYRYFQYLINWENIFSLPAELIHILIRTSINNFRKTKNKSLEDKREIRKYIKRKLKRKHIIETFYGKYCSACKEFSVVKHLPAIVGHHADKKTKTINASKLYDLSCSEIVKILEQEKVGYICANCHKVIHNKFIHLSHRIYEDKNIAKKIIDDYNNTNSRYTLSVVQFQLLIL
ncbi:MAG: hypothetical protein EU529_03200 [Promethearchaeota archaeon]|nr:MAG: hypothetical protein EU529_03200 [Candidatus Lokiarchaeota archaeon]